MLPGQLLRVHATSPPPDMSPFFLRQYVKGHAADVFEAYPQLLTEMVLRLPYQVGRSYTQTLNGPFRELKYHYNSIVGAIVWDPNKVIDIGEWSICGDGRLKVLLYTILEAYLSQLPSSKTIC